MKKSQMDQVKFQKTADGALEYCLDRPRNRIIIAIPYTAKKSFNLLVQKVLIDFAQGKAEVIRVKHKTVVGMTLLPNDPADMFAIFDRYPEQKYRDRLIKLLWHSVSTDGHLDEVQGVDEMAERS